MVEGGGVGFVSEREADDGVVALEGVEEGRRGLVLEAIVQLLLPGHLPALEIDQADVVRARIACRIISFAFIQCKVMPISSSTLIDILKENLMAGVPSTATSAAAPQRWE